MSQSLTYASYLRLAELLSLQTLRSRELGDEEHDEMLFIVIHQVYELWFKQLLHEIDHVQALMTSDDVIGAGRGLRRILSILKVMVSQMDVLETMTPRDFLSFRDRLEASSGFQSAQFREFEFVLGHKRPDIAEGFGGTERERLERRLHEPSLWSTFRVLLARRDVVSERIVDETAPTEPDPALQSALVDVYRHQPELAELCERLVDLDEGIQEWRYRHVKMVERTIGSKMGTGGSNGVEYLASTLSKPLFPDLWAVRALL
ncbi:MAG: tryptophan 2,3-dioxygenase [Ilumatobacteraceae bacterium]